MTTSTKLIDLRVSGTSAKYLVDALLEELPPPDVIKRTILRDLPKSLVIVKEDVVYIECSDRQLLASTLPLFEHMYPELDFVNLNKTDKR